MKAEYIQYGMELRRQRSAELKQLEQEKNMKSQEVERFRARRNEAERLEEQALALEKGGFSY